MILSERQQYILEVLRRNSSVSVSELSKTMQVSEVTIRKDLTQMEQLKLLYRTHGKAVLLNPFISDRHINEKERNNAAEKLAISRHAASMIASGESIMIASGTTMHFLAREIKPLDRLTVVTSAVPVTSILLKEPTSEVILLGGAVRPSSLSVVGPYAEQMLENFLCSKLFLGVDGIDFEFGLTTTNLMEASLNRAMMRAAQQTIVLADSSKFGRRGFSRICAIDAVNEIITDDKIADDIASRIEDCGVKLTVVPLKDTEE